ncbi:hypothetical protein GCM10027436_47360 [Actinophytocola sediminis]
MTDGLPDNTTIEDNRTSSGDTRSGSIVGTRGKRFRDVGATASAVARRFPGYVVLVVSVLLLA